MRNYRQIYAKMALRRANPSANCHYCGCILVFDRNNPRERTIDHYIPLSKGGTWSPDNLVDCCRRCNVLKGRIEPDLFEGFIAEYGENFRLDGDAMVRAALRRYLDDGGGSGAVLAELGFMRAMA